MEAYQQDEWPGNVQELINAVERWVILTSGNMLNAYVPASTNQTETKTFWMEEMERKYISDTLWSKTNWRVQQ